MSINPSGVIDFFEHPPIGLLPQPVLDLAGPYSGTSTLTTYENPAGHTNLVSATYGVRVTVNGAIPPELGLTFGWVDPTGVYDETEYQFRLFQLVVQHQLTLSSVWISDEVHDLHVIDRSIFWANALPGRIGLFVLPNLAADLYYYPKPL